MDLEQNLSAEELENLKKLKKSEGIKQERARIFLEVQEEAQHLEEKLKISMQEQKSGSLLGYSYSAIVSADVDDFDKRKQFAEKYDPNGEVESPDAERVKLLRIATLQKLGFMDENGAFFRDVDTDLTLMKGKGEGDSDKTFYYAQSTTIDKAWLTRTISSFPKADGSKGCRLLETINHGSEDAVRGYLGLPLTVKVK